MINIAVWFEREVIEIFAPLYGFDLDNLWGLVTMSGTDGNNHGLYFGMSYLKNKTGKMPIAYVSDEAHYSNYRLCDLQNLDVCMVKNNENGQMIPEEFEKVLDPTRPCPVRPPYQVKEMLRVIFHLYNVLFITFIV